MQSYVTAERLTVGGQLPSLQPLGSASTPQAATGPTRDSPLIDQLLGRLADLVVDRLMARSPTETKPPDERMDARAAAVYLGVHRDTLRKLAAERAVPVHQDGPGVQALLPPRRA
jgi:excisionase family DNA binding protein